MNQYISKIIYNTKVDLIDEDTVDHEIATLCSLISRRGRNADWIGDVPFCMCQELKLYRDTLRRMNTS